MTGVRRATKDDRDTIAAVMASAFSDDPLFMWMAGLTAPDESRLRPMFSDLARVQLAKADHELYVNETGDGAAIWLGVDRWKTSVGDLIRTTGGALRTFRTHGLRAIRTLGAMEKVHPTAPHYYLEYLGTRADRRGRGIGTALMAPMLERCDDEGLPAYLESTPKARSLYHRHGFVPCGDVALPKGCPPLHPMWREPR